MAAENNNTIVTYSANGGQWVDEDNASKNVQVKIVHVGFSMATFMQMNAEADRQAEQQLLNAQIKKEN